MIFWGKAEQRQRANSGQVGPNINFLSVWEHCLDVTAVARAWLESREMLFELWTRLLGLDNNGRNRETAMNIGLHFILLHDLGKYDFRFQGKSLRSWDKSIKINEKDARIFKKLNGFDIPKSKNAFDHGAWGLMWYAHIEEKKNVIKPQKIPWFHLLRSTMSHHGSWIDDWKKPKPGLIVPDDNWPITPEDAEKDRQNAIISHVQRAKTLFPLPEFKKFKKLKCDAIAFLAGLCSVSDWLGSNTSFFPCKPTGNYMEPCSITKEMEKSAYDVLRANHMLGKYCGTPENRDARIFSGISNPKLRPLQQVTADMELSKSPQMVIIEAPMVEGKTAAAMLVADRLLSAGYAEKLYFALPTMATSNAMYDRMEKMMRNNRFFDESSSLVLAHSKRGLRDEFQRHIIVEPVRELGGDSKFQNAGAMCNAFFTQGKKRSLLAQAGTGTVDQIMSAVLGQRHHWIKLFALSNAVIIIDEVHAYDAYMQAILKKLMCWIEALGSHVILLSATLPKSIRTELSSHLPDSSSDTKKANGYPLVTWLGGEKKSEFHECKASDSLEKNVRFVMSNDMSKIFSELVGHARLGAQCCVILNTVARAQELYDLFDRNGLGNDAELLLFHSRFMFKDRSRLENEVMSRFGTKGKGRTKGRILIATQVVEQSLDVDFDVMISEIAPIDLLLQRAGRLQRFAENNEIRLGKLWENPQLVVFNPCPDASGLLDDRKINLEARSVYDAAVLYRTALLINSRELMIKIPEDIRNLVNRVYDKQGIEIPDEDKELHDKRWSEWKSERALKILIGNNVVQPLPSNKPLRLITSTNLSEDLALNELLDNDLQQGSTRLAPESIRILFADQEWLQRKENFRD
ncbi:CRISPR-associated helicase Cas3', partial [Desulfobacterales bacterium HSG16]|nr:CRISPR-associated helicase Cas3' [Desulfobacterales bacterium HSG16]